MLSRFTAYTAVDRSNVVNEGGRQHSIVQPVEVPAGWAKNRVGLMPRAVGVMARRSWMPSKLVADVPASAGPPELCAAMCERRAETAAPARGVGELFAKIRTATLEAERSLVSSLKKRSTAWKPLLELLEELAAAMEQSGREAGQEIQELIRRGRAISAGAEASKNRALDVAEAKRYLDCVLAMLDSMQGTAKPDANRAKFWK